MFPAFPKPRPSIFNWLTSRNPLKNASTVEDQFDSIGWSIFGHDELPMILTDQQNRHLCFYYQPVFAYQNSSK
jgi:hypothetical protein